MDLTVLSTVISGIESDVTALLPALFGILAFFMGINIVVRMIRRFASA